MKPFLAAFIPALLLGWLILHFRSHHESLTGDTVDGGPQKIHSGAVPRIGGLMIFTGFCGGILCVCLNGHLTFSQGAMIVLCGLPAFAAGFFEDITKRGGVLLRLFATFIAAGLAFWLLGARLDRLDFPAFDQWLAFVPVSLLFTMFAAGGVSQSLNIIDGLNGLATFVGIVMLAALGAVAWRLGDVVALSICLAACGGLLGFLAWNFPRGRIFCGDGGAYFTGFLVAEVSILLVHRHAEVSSWFPLLLAAYPVWETLFSIYRRKVVGRRAAMRPDALHLHSLVFRWVRAASRARSGEEAWWCNPLSSALCWLLPGAAALIAMLYWNETWKLVMGASGFALAYVLAYRELARPGNWRAFLRRARRGQRGAAALRLQRSRLLP